MVADKFASHYSTKEKVFCRTLALAKFYQPRCSFWDVDLLKNGDMVGGGG
jgi:hypothetical protein